MINYCFFKLYNLPSSMVGIYILKIERYNTREHDRKKKNTVERNARKEKKHMINAGEINES